jgi:uncharacterized protein DUF2690
MRKLSDDVPPLTAGLTRDIRAAYERAGSPSYTTLGQRNRRAGRGVLSKATISRIMTPDPHAKDQKSLPNWAYYEDLLQVLDQDPESFHARWETAQREWRARSPMPEGTSADPEDAAGKPWWRSRWFAVGAAVAVVAAVAIAVWWPRSPEQATESSGTTDKRMDNTDPSDTGCTPQMDEQTYWSHLYHDWPTNTRQTGVLVTMHYSPECRTSWAVLSGAPPGTRAVLHRNSDRTELRCVAGAQGSCTTKQLSDRGTTIHAFARADDAYGQTRDH